MSATRQDQLTRDNLSRFFRLRVLDQGRDHTIAGEVTDFSVENHETECELHATVLSMSFKNRPPMAYDVEVTIVYDADNLIKHIFSFCDCSKTFECSHAAAAIWELCNRMEADFSSSLHSFNRERFLRVFNNQVEQQQSESGDSPHKSNECLVYCLTRHPASGHNNFRIEAYNSRVLKNGKGYGKCRWISLSSMIRGFATAPPYSNETDLELLSAFTKTRHQRRLIEETDIRHQQGYRIMEILLESQRCFVERVGLDQHLRSGEARSLQLEWQQNDHEHFNLVMKIDGERDGDIDILPTIPALYLDRRQLTVGKLTTSIPGGELDALSKLSNLTSEDMLYLQTQLAYCDTFNKIAFPETVNQLPVEEGDPTPELHFHSAATEAASSNHPAYTATFSIAYNGQTIDLQNPELLYNNRHTMIKRHATREQLFLNQLVDAGFMPAPEQAASDAQQLSRTYQFKPQQSSILQAWQHFYQEQLPQWRDQGWAISFDDDFRGHIIEADEVIADVEEDEEASDWFDIHLKVNYQNQQIEIQELLVNYLSQGDHKTQAPILTQLPDGTHLSIPYRFIEPVINSLVELGELEGGNTLKMSAWQAGTLLSLEEQLGASGAVNYSRAEALRSFVQQCQQIEQLPQLPVPQGLQATLRDYQQFGFSWFQFLANHNMMGVLADDMGLGKTIQVLAWLQYQKENGYLKQPALIVAPTSVMGNWLREAQRFTPALSVLLHHGSGRSATANALSSADVVITSYPLILKDQALHRHMRYFAIVLDEAQVIKNPKTQQAQAIFTLKGSYRFCLTGTPMENHLGELWSLFNFLMPGFLGNHTQFSKYFKTPIEKYNNTERLTLLKKRLAPFLLRRTKTAVAEELPRKTEIKEIVELPAAQKKLYESIRVTMEKKVRDLLNEKGLANSHIHILDALLKLRQACCHPQLIQTSQAQKITDSAKLNHLLELLATLLEEGRKVLIFSQFVAMLDKIAEALQQKGISYRMLTGQTRKRQAEIDSFSQQDDSQVFLISLKAGGTGLNLMAADTVIHYDPWWNPAVEDQATDRAYRIGQDKPVTVYKLIAKETVEEKIMTLQERKAALTARMYTENNQDSFKLSEEEIAELFKPVNSLTHETA